MKEDYNKNFWHKFYRVYLKIWRVLLSLVLIASAAGIYFFFFAGTETVKASWWNDSWLYRKDLTINHAQVAGDLVDFPVLVSRTDSDFVGKAQDDGGDFVFTLNDGTVLKHEIESYASSTGALVAWVKLPALSATEDADIFMYYGNAGGENQETTNEAWDENFVGVWHFPYDSTSSTTDSTDNNNDGIAEGNASSTAAGKVGGAFGFDGANDRINCGSGESLDNLSTITICSWVNPVSKPNAYPVIGSKQTSNTGWDFYLISAGSFGSSYGTSTTFIAKNAMSGGVANNNWHYLCATQNGNNASNMTLYYNGIATSSTGTGVGVRADDSANNLVFGADSAWLYDFNGYLDEIKVSKIVRAAAWIQTEYNNQIDPASFFSVQAEETGPGPVGYWSFDEGYGATTHDASGQGNDGAITGAVWKDESECVSGKCLWFDGENL